MKNLIQKLLKNKFFMSFFVLCSGSLWAQGITFLCSLLLTRIYLPYDLGILTYVLSFSTMFTYVICGKYDIKIVDAPEEEVAPLIHLSFFLSSVFSVLVTGGVYVYLLLTHASPVILKYAWVCFLILFLYGIMNILNAYNNRMEEYKIMAKVYLFRSVAQNAIMLILGLLHCGAAGLFTGQVSGYLAGMRLQSKSLRDHKILQAKVDLRKTYAVFKKNINMLVFSVPASFVDSLSYSLLSVGIGNLFGMVELGFYCISLRILGLPLTVFSSNISRLHYRNSVQEKQDRGNYFRSTVKTLMFSFLIILPISVFLILAAPFLFRLLFGPDWTRGGEFVQILAIMYVFRFMIGSVAYSFILADRQKLELIFQLLLLAGFIIAFSCVKMFSFSIEHFLSLVMVLYSCVYVCEILFVIHLSKKNRCLAA